MSRRARSWWQRLLTRFGLISSDERPPQGPSPTESAAAASDAATTITPVRPAAQAPAIRTEAPTRSKGSVVPTLDNLLERLERHRQPATYGAVAGVVGSHPRSVMSGRTRNERNSWVVSKETLQPSGYQPHEMHPDLQAAVAAVGVLSTPEALRAWLEAHP